ncbi:MAG TPA: SDR family NAD(P)-dependent oxidoreductase [Nevskiaceae bacterium]
MTGGAASAPADGAPKATPRYEALLSYTPAPDALQGRVIAITGAAAGIGRAVAVAAAAHGAELIALDRNRPALDALKAELEGRGTRIEIVAMDFDTATLVDYRKFAESVGDAHGRLDALVNNAGHIVELSPFEFIEPSVFTQVLATNLVAPFFLTQWCVPLLRKAPDPALVFSLHRAQRAFWGAYGVAKAGQEALLHILADEYHLAGASPMRVVGVDPGPVSTAERHQHYPGERRDAHPAPEAVVGPYLYALGPDARGLTDLVLRSAKA